METIILPKIGQTMESANIDRWLIQEGDKVGKGDVILEVTTDKATVDVECFAEGVVLKIVAQEGEEKNVGDVLAWVGEAGEKAPSGDSENASETPTPSTASTTSNQEPHSAPVASTERVRATPRARKLARNLGLNIQSIKGTGPGGRITEDDVKNHGGETDAVTSPATGEIFTSKQPLSAMRKTIAERMTQSAQQAPHFYLTLDIDMTEAISFRKNYKETSNENLSYHDLVARACAKAIADQPKANATWLGDAIGLRASIDIGLAVSLEEGLIVPVIRAADKKDLKTIATESANLIDRARTQKLTPDEYGEASLTISNLGMLGIKNFLPILNLGESLILGTGALVETPIVREGQVVIRTIMTVTLACDHRVIDGAVAAGVLKQIKDVLESPEHSR